MKGILACIILLSLAICANVVSGSSFFGDDRRDPGTISDQYNFSNVRCDDPESVNKTRSHSEGKIPILKPTQNQAGETVIVTSGGNLDKYLYWPSTIEFDMLVKTADSEIHFGQLTLSIYDVDQFCEGACSGNCEVDPVYLNGHYLGTLTGANNEWSTTTFILSPSWINGANGASPGINHVKIVIDDSSKSCWATECDWGQLIINSGAKGNAKIVSISSDRQAYSPGDSINAIIGLTTDQESQAVKLETNLYDIYGKNVDGHSATLTLNKNSITTFNQKLLIPANAASGDFHIEAIVYGSNSIQQDKKSKMVTVGSLPDFYVSTEDISFLKIDTGSSGLEVYGGVSIHYENDNQPRDVIIKFYDEDSKTGRRTQINSQTANLLPGINKVPLVWNPSSREHSLCVVIDPDNKVKESNENNNEASNFLKGPIIYEVTSWYTGYFLSLWPLTNVYTVKTSEDVKSVGFIMNGVLKIDNDGSDGWSMGYDMGSLPSPSELVIIALDGANMASQPYTITPQVVTLPEWLAWAINGNCETDTEGGQVTYKLKNKITFPEPPMDVKFTIPNFVPIVSGKYGYKGSFNFGFEGNNLGLATLFGGGEAGLHVAGHDGTIGATLEAALRAATLYLESAAVKVSGEVELPLQEWKPPSFYVPLIGDVGVKAGVNLIPGLELVANFEQGKGGLIPGWDWKSGEATLSTALEGYVKDSEEKYVEGTVVGEPSLTGQVPQPYFKQVAVDIYMKLKIIFMGWGTEFEYHPLGLPWSYPKSNYIQNKPLLVNSTEWKPIPRDYATSNYASFTGSRANLRKMGLSTLELNLLAVQENPLVEDAFPYASPSIAINGDDNMTMVWCHDDINKPQIKGFEIHYSTWDGGSWSIPSQVTDNYLPEFDPSVKFDKDGDAIAVWTLFNNTSISANTLIFSVLGDAELEYSVLNKTTGLWCTPEALTRNSVFEDYLTLSTVPNGNVAATWVVDKDNNLTTDSDRDIYYSIWDGSDWTEPKIIAENVRTDTKPAIAYSETNGVCVWSADIDGNSTTMDDRDLSYSEWNGSQWSNPELLTNDKSEDTKPKLQFDKSNNIVLAWVKQNETNDRIYTSKFDNSWSSPELVAKSTTINEMDLSFDSHNNAIVVWQGASLLGQDIFYTVCDHSNNIWRNEKQLTNDMAAEWQLSTAIKSNDELVVSYVKKNMTLVNHTFEEGKSDLYYLIHPIMPDVTLDTADIIFSNETAFPGDQITINATVHNIGDLEANSVDVAFFDGLNGPQIGTTQTIPLILAGQNATMSVIWNIPALQQSHDICVKIDLNNDITETNESNNVAFKSTVLPDLKINKSDITYYYGQKSLWINTTVHNLGVISASNISVELFDGGINGTLINATTITTLSPNSNETISTIWDVSKVSSGRHDVYVAVDRLNSIHEQNETNNMAKLGTMILPDLALNANNVSISETSEGNATIEVVISNIGLSSAENVTIELSDGNISTNGTLIGNVTIDAIPPDSKSTIDIDWYATLGQHEINVRIDPHNLIQELDKANNMARNRVLISPGMDLVMNSTDITFSDANELRQVMISVLIHNVGTADAPSTTVGFYNGTPEISQTNPYETYVPNLLGTEAVPPIPEHNSVKVNLTTIWNPESGKLYNIYVFVDPKDCIHEMNESNNLNSDTFTIDTPPNTPSIPSGPKSGYAWVPYSYSTSAIDLDGDQMKYTFDWGDGTTSATNLVKSGTSASAIHAWSKAGTFKVKAKATDIIGQSSDWSNTLTVTVKSNKPPNRPDKPAGLIRGGIAGSSYSFSTSTTDPDKDRVMYTFDWGDGTKSDTNLVNSGKRLSLMHAWNRAGAYQVKANATDDKGAASGYSSETTVIINPNKPPRAPQKIFGSTNGFVGLSYRYYTWASDPDKDKVMYTFNWGDGSSSSTNLVKSGTVTSLSHAWNKAGIYNIIANASDSKGAISRDSGFMTVSIAASNPPNKPSVPIGPASGRKGVSYSYSSSATDPNGDNVNLTFDWGDGSTTITPSTESGKRAVLSHKWSMAGTYTIRVKAIDSKGAASISWSNSLSVKIN
jgi:subtilase family serine protease